MTRRSFLEPWCCDEKKLIGAVVLLREEAYWSRGVVTRRSLLELWCCDEKKLIGAVVL